MERKACTDSVQSTYNEISYNEISYIEQIIYPYEPPLVYIRSFNIEV